MNHKQNHHNVLLPVNSKYQKQERLVNRNIQINIQKVNSNKFKFIKLYSTLVDFVIQDLELII